jgi:hypothetical protein
MAIQDYMKICCGSQTVSKQQVMRFIELQFARADKNHDGEFDFDELGGVRACHCMPRFGAALIGFLESFPTFGLA